MKRILSLLLLIISFLSNNAQSCIKTTLLNPIDSVHENEFYIFYYKIESLKDTLIISRLTSGYGGQVGSYHLQRKIYPNYPDTVSLSTSFSGKQGTRFLGWGYIEFANKKDCNSYLQTDTYVKTDK